MKVKVCKYREIGAFKKFTVLDLHRIIDSMRLNHRSSDTAMLNAVLNAFGIKDVVCGAINVFAFFQNIGLIGALYLLLKMLKGFVLLYNLIRGASLKIIKASIALISFEITSTVLTKVALRFVAFSAALDILIASIGLYADYLTALNPFVSFMNLVCEENTAFEQRSQALVYGLEATKIALEIKDNQSAIGDAIQVIDEVSNEN